MCSNYHPAMPGKLRFHFGVAHPDSEFKAESYPGYMAPMIRLPRADSVPGDRACTLAMFGMVPHRAETKLILRPDQYDELLNCPVEETPSFYTRHPAEPLAARPTRPSRQTTQQSIA
jgi:hypothetical protein